MLLGDLKKETLDRLIRERDFPVIRLGKGNRFFREQSVVEWLKEQKNLEIAGESQ